MYTKGGQKKVYRGVLVSGMLRDQRWLSRGFLSIRTSDPLVHNLRIRWCVNVFAHLGLVPTGELSVARAK